MDGLSKVIYDILNDQDGAIVYDTEVVSEDYVPLAIKIIRRYIIPEGKKRKSPSEINDHLIEIEHELKLNYEARKRLRRLLFSSNKDLNNTIAMGDFQVSLFLHF